MLIWIETRFRALRTLVSRDPGALWARWGNQAHYGPQQADYFERAARLGDAEGMYRLGLVYWKGAVWGKSEEKAMEWILKAAQQGHPEAMRHAAQAFQWGRGVPRNPGRAELWGRQADAVGAPVEDVRPLHKESIWELWVEPWISRIEGFWDRGFQRKGFRLGFQALLLVLAALFLAALVLGAVLSASHIIGLVFLALAFLASIPLGLWAWALRMEHQGPWRRARRLEAKAAEGKPEACLELGLALQKGRYPFQPDEETAARWLRQAAEAGHPEAMFRLGLAFA